MVRALRMEFAHVKGSSLAVCAHVKGSSLAVCAHVKGSSLAVCFSKKQGLTPCVQFLLILGE
jgi:hypothetical protein